MSCIIGNHALCEQLHEKVSALLTLKSFVNVETVYNNISKDESGLYIIDNSSLIGDYDNLFGEGFKKQFTENGQKILLKLMFIYTNIFRASVFKKIYDKWMNLFNTIPSNFKIDEIVGESFYLGRPVTVNDLDYIALSNNEELYKEVFEVFDPILQVIQTQTDSSSKTVYRCSIPLSILDTVFKDKATNDENEASISVYQMLIGYQAYRVIQTIIEEHLINDELIHVGEKYFYMGDTYIFKYHDNKSLYFEKVN